MPKEGGVGVGWREAQEGGEYVYTYGWFTVVVQQKPTQRCKAIIFQ